MKFKNYILKFFLGYFIFIFFFLSSCNKKSAPNLKVNNSKFNQVMYKVNFKNFYHTPVKDILKNIPAPVKLTKEMILLKNSLQDTDKLNYIATKVSLIFAAENKQKTLANIFHSKNGKVKMVYFYPEEIKGLIILTDKEKKFIFNPKNKKVILNVNEPFSLNNELFNLIVKNYSINLKGNEKIADRLCNIIKLKPLTNVLPILKLWIDVKDNQIIKTEYYDDEGALQSVSYFTKINFNPKFKDDSFELETETKMPVKGFYSFKKEKNSNNFTLNNFKSYLKSNIFLPNLLPRGFILFSAKISNFKDKKSVHFIFTNGLENISLFETKEAVNIKKFKQTREFNDYINHTLVGQQNVVYLKKKSISFFFISSLEKDLLIKIANSLKEY